MSEMLQVTCRTCSGEFPMSHSDLDFLAIRGLDASTALCPNCREQLRAKYTAWNSAYSGPARASREMYPAVCAECGQDTLVPFAPKENRPVYCANCFAKVRPGQTPPSES
jgi:CxxC-x17-CxxC domain-containing protein